MTSESHNNNNNNNNNTEHIPQQIPQSNDIIQTYTTTTNNNEGSNIGNNNNKNSNSISARCDNNNNLYNNNVLHHRKSSRQQMSEAPSPGRVTNDNLNRAHQFIKDIRENPMLKDVASPVLNSTIELIYETGASFVWMPVNNSKPQNVHVLKVCLSI